MGIHQKYIQPKHPKKTAKELYKQAHETLLYDPDTGMFLWKLKNKKHPAGSPAGSVVQGGYIRIFLKPLSYPDGMLAYLMMTGELHPHIGRFDLNVANCKFDNLYPSDHKVVNNLLFPRYSKKDLAKFLETNPLPIGKLASELRTVAMSIRFKLRDLVVDGYVELKGKKVYTLTALGHRELFRGGEFLQTDRNVETYLFQHCLPGTLTGGNERKILKWELR